jgi:hypothetical protein
MMENKMEERNWKYKITGNWTAVIAVAITTAVFGGVAFWCRTAGNQGGLVGFGGLTAFFAIVCIRLIYAELSFRLLVDESGFYFRTTLRDGRYYRYREIRSMWLATDGMTDLQQATYCNFETMDGKRSRFLVLDPNLDAVDYMIERVEAVGASREEDDRDREFVIPGKRKVGGLVIFAVLLFPVLYLIFRWTSMPLILRIIPVAVVLIPVVKVFSYGLFFKLMIQKDGFYCRTNPFDGRYYRYGDILDCCLVEAERGTRRHETYYAYYMKFTDRANRTHRVLYDKSLYEREMNELVARIERAKEDEE